MSQERSKVIQMRNKIFVILTILILMATSVATAFADVNEDMFAGIEDEEFRKALTETFNETTENALDIGNQIASGSNVVEDKLEKPEWSGNAIDYKDYVSKLNAVEAAERKSEVTDNMSASKKIDETTEFYSFTVKVDKSVLGISLGAAVNGVANIVFGLAKMWIGFSAKVTGWALKFEMYSVLQSGIDGIMSKITGITGNTLSRSDTGIGGMIWLGVAFSLASVALLFFRRQTAGAFGKLLGTIFIVTLIGSYMILPNNFMGWMQSFATDVGTSILKTNGSTNPGDSATEAIWIMGVDQPWQDIEFGKIIDKAPGGALSSGGEAHNWLTYMPKDRGNPDIQIEVPGGEDTRMLDDAATQALKVGQSLFILIIDFVLGLLFLLLAAVALGFQIGSIVMWIMGFFVFIVALFPTHGTGKIKEWGATLALTYFGQIVIYVILLLVTQIMAAFYEFNELFKVFGAMAGLAAGIYIMKRPIMSLFSGGAGGLREAGAGGVIDMGKAARARLGGGNRGDSTERFMPSPIRQNREAKRQAQRQVKMQKYQGKIADKQEKQAAKRERSISRAAAGYAGAKVNEAKDKMTAPIQSAANKVNMTKGEVADKLRTRQSDTAQRVEQRQAARQDNARRALEEKAAIREERRASASRREEFASRDVAPRGTVDRTSDGPVMRADPPAAKVSGKTVAKPTTKTSQKVSMKEAPQKRARRSNAPPRKMNK